MNRTGIRLPRPSSNAAAHCRFEKVLRQCESTRELAHSKTWRNIVASCESSFGARLFAKHQPQAVRQFSYAATGFGPATVRIGLRVDRYLATSSRPAKILPERGIHSASLPLLRARRNEVRAPF